MSLQLNRENSLMFREYLRRLESSKVCQNLNMQSFLLLPMQRITRLPLLILAILNRTPLDYPDQPLVEATLRTVQKVWHHWMARVEERGVGWWCTVPCRGNNYYVCFIRQDYPIVLWSIEYHVGNKSYIYTAYYMLSQQTLHSPTHTLTVGDLLQWWSPQDGENWTVTRDSQEALLW